MEALLEFYDDQGRCFRSIHCKDEVVAIAILAAEIAGWRNLGFRNASCYVDSKEVWNLEIKD